MWRSRLFWRLFGAYSVLLAIALGVLGWWLLRRIEAYLLTEIQQGLEMKAVLVQELVAGQTLGPEERQRQTQRIGEETQSRITLIARDGRVLADSAEEPEQMENHLQRPEVQRAETHGTGAATRYSTTVRHSMMYVARRTALPSVRYVRVALPLGAVEGELRWVRRIVWTAAGATLLFALFISLILARRISAPLVELAQAARSVAKGAYGTRVLVGSHDEAGTLASAFNEMSQACAVHITQMDQDRQQLRTILSSMAEGVLVLDADQCVQFLNEAASRLLKLAPGAVHGRKLWEVVRHHPLGMAVEQVFSGEKPYECELEWIAAKRKVLALRGTRLSGNPPRGAVLVLHDITHLRKLERVRQDFVANVSHELKTPLAAIKATVETLLDGAIQDQDNNTRFLKSIGENAERLHRLVLDLLTLGRIESGQEVMNLQAVDLQAAVAACVARLTPGAAAKELRLEQAVPPEAVMVLADEDALADILNNLVDNAIKYTPSGGRINVRWFAEGKEAVLHIEDTGIGIPEKDLPRIFERFYRVDKARSREVGGTGLGLSIVKHLVQALRGSIDAASQVGAGSTFTVRLPLAERREPTATAIETSPNVAAVGEPKS